MTLIARAFFLLPLIAIANPYPDPSQVPLDLPYRPSDLAVRVASAEDLREAGEAVVRITVAWSAQDEKYEVVSAYREKSGTLALNRRATQKDELGSYHGSLTDAEGTTRYDSIGTGANYRKLVREFTFRFPLPESETQFRFFAENPTTGKTELALTKQFSLKDFEELTDLPSVVVREIGATAASDQLILNIYADGYPDDRQEAFFSSAKKVADVLKSTSFPGVERLAFRAVFAPSATKLGKAKNLGLPIPERDAFLGLYFPYWNNFGRWYHVVYPTREARYRKSLATVPYDYPLALLDDGEYWGVGNYRELTAIPAQSSQFAYLLTHELGHFFGLNEEYEGGGPTELEFAPGIHEPWSQNITFLRDPSKLKWQQHLLASTPIPTPASHWKGNGPFGAYKGGYADSAPAKTSHKPGENCTMKSGKKFCPICVHAINERLDFDLGL